MLNELKHEELRSIQESADEFAKADPRWKAYFLKMIECLLLKGQSRILQEAKGVA